jgi:hypothetical protein
MTEPLGRRASQVVRRDAGDFGSVARREKVSPHVVPRSEQGLKIAERFHGYRYGELLLKTLFHYLVENRYTGVFVDTDLSEWSPSALR